MNKVKDKVKKVPVVVQLDAVECGAAALSMILAYYGKWLSLEQLRTDCGISRDGSNGRSIIPLPAVTTLTHMATKPILLIYPHLLPLSSIGTTTTLSFLKALPAAWHMSTIPPLAALP